MKRLGWVALGLSAAAYAAKLPPPVHVHSPNGRYEVQIEPLTDDWTHAKKAQAGVVRDAMEEYAMAFGVVGSSDPMAVVYYADSGPRVTADDVAKALMWSTDDSYIVFPDRPHAWEPGHALQKVVGLRSKKVWSLECDHVHWLDGHRFVADINTPGTPGGVILFDGDAGIADLLIPPDHGIGYQIADFSGHQAVIREILNTLGDKKTTWDVFTPACFALDLDTLKKRSVPCPKHS